MTAQPVALASPATQAGVAVDWLRRAALAVHEQRAWLTGLDAAIGDGDHGINLDRGLSLVVAGLLAAPPPAEAGALLTLAGRRLLGLMGGASGALYGRALMTAGERLTARGETALEWLAFADAVLAGVIDAIAALGRAVPGDKTMLDALTPALAALRSAPDSVPLDAALRSVVAAAEAGAQASVPLIARKGRASYLGERSAGHLDPGAASSAMLVACLAEAILAARPTPQE